MNKVFLIGRVANDIDVRYTPTQVASLNLSIAIDRGKDKDGKDKGTDFPRVTVFGKQAENCERFLAKGKKIAVEAHVQTGSYQKDGKTIYTTDLIADRIEYLTKAEKEPTPQTELTPPADLGADIPF